MKQSRVSTRREVTVKPYRRDYQSGTRTLINVPSHKRWLPRRHDDDLVVRFANFSLIDNRVKPYGKRRMALDALKNRMTVGAYRARLNRIGLHGYGGWVLNLALDLGAIRLV
jgi:hypothetical protein